MRGYRFKIAFLTLGVVLGYGSAIRHWIHDGYGYGMHGHHHCHGHGGRDFGGHDDYDHDHPHAQPPAKSGT